MLINQKCMKKNNYILTVVGLILVCSCNGTKSEESNVDEQVNVFSIKEKKLLKKLSVTAFHSITPYKTVSIASFL